MCITLTVVAATSPGGWRARQTGPMQEGIPEEAAGFIPSVSPRPGEGREEAAWGGDERGELPHDPAKTAQFLWGRPWTWPPWGPPGR